MLPFLRRWSLLLPGLLLLGLFLYMTAPGFAGTGDSRHYLWAAYSWREAGRLLAPDGRLYRYWGPLYPVLLAAFWGPGALRVLHGAALLAQLGLWGRMGRWLLPPGRALWLPWLLALSAAALVPAKFVWSETVFGALAAGYVFGLLAWVRSGRAGWLGLATAVGFLLPLQRTAGFFWLGGVGAGLLFTGQGRGRWGPLLGHWALCAVGGLAWSYYAEVLAGPPTYQTKIVWNALGSVADYGYVLARWFLPLAASWRELLPLVWALGLPVLLFVLYPKRAQMEREEPAEPSAEGQPTGLRGQRLLWWALALTLLALLLATAARRAAAGPHNVERYCAVLAGPVLLLALARWPGLDGRGQSSALSRRTWLGSALLGAWLAYSAARTGHNARQQHLQQTVVAWPTGPLPTAKSLVNPLGDSLSRFHAAGKSSQAAE